MSESASGLSDLLDDYAERNSALYLFLGLLGQSVKLKQTLEVDALDAVTGPATKETKLDYLVLGLVALADNVLAAADQVKDDIVAPTHAPAEHPLDLLR
jgi:hypothetical protein